MRELDGSRTACDGRRGGSGRSAQFCTQKARPERFELPAPRFVGWCSASEVRTVLVCDFCSGSLRGYLAAIAIFCNEVKGKSAFALSRDLGLSYKAAFVLLHKLREAMAEEMKGRKLGGEGKVAEVDGGYFGGYVKPANHRENRRDRRLACNQNGKRKAVVIIRERNGRSLPAVFRTEGQALSFIRSRIAKGTIINADEGSS
jgi:hypothetical protein